MSRRIITIDGPAGAGKGTVAKIVAKELQLIQLDSGALYRLLTLHFLQHFHTIGFEDQDILVDALSAVSVSLNIENNKIRWFLNNAPVGSDIYSSEISLRTAHFSTLIPVREKVNILLRELSMHHDIIIDGRDMGSVVFPHATLKIYLDADATIRAERRLKQLLAKGETATYNEVLAQTIERDTLDKNKEFGALKVPEGAYLIDSSYLTIEDTAEKIITLYKQL